MDCCGGMKYEEFCCDKCYAYVIINRLPIAKYGSSRVCTLLPGHFRTDTEHKCLTGYMYTRSMELCDCNNEVLLEKEK
jgi:hypothetical protein